MKLVALLVIPFFAGGCGVVHFIERQTVSVTGSGKSKTEQRQVRDFQSIEIRGGVDVAAQVGSEFAVSVIADDNIVSLIQTRVENGVLIVESKESYSSELPVKVVLSAPEINGVSIHGSGDVTVSGVDSDAFKVSVMGSGDVRVDGSARSAEASITGSGDIDLKGLNAKRATASISGSGDIAVSASEQLDASIAGSGDIAYFGDPAKVERSVAGSGSIHKG